MNIDLIKELLEKRESESIDFKTEIDPDILSSNKDKKRTAIAKLVKDITAIANTIIDSKGFLIYGFDDNEKEIIGVSEFVDDADIQKWLSKYTDPIVKCGSGKIKVENKFIGYIEIYNSDSYLHAIKETVKNVFYIGQVWKRRSSENVVCLYNDLTKYFSTEYITFEGHSSKKIKELISNLEKEGYETIITRYSQLGQYLLDGWERVRYPLTKQFVAFTQFNSTAIISILLKRK